jgi:hypothetical protein
MSSRLASCTKQSHHNTTRRQPRAKNDLDKKRIQSTSEAWDVGITNKKKHWWTWRRNETRTRDDADIAGNDSSTIYRINHNSSEPALMPGSAASSHSCRTSMESTRCVRATSLTGREQKALEKRIKQTHKLQKRRQRRGEQDIVDGLALGGLCMM